MRELHVPLAYGTDYKLEVDLVSRRIVATCLWDGCGLTWWGKERRVESKKDAAINQLLRDGIRRKAEIHVDREHYDSRFATASPERRREERSEVPPF